MRYALAQSLLSPVVCPSVRLSLHPSVTSVDCIQTAEGIVKPLSQLGSPIILVFFTPSASTQFQGQGRPIIAMER